MLDERIIDDCGTSFIVYKRVSSDHMGVQELSICDGCGYNLGNACQVLNNKQTESCFAKASKEEVIRCEKDIEDYAFRFEEREFRNSSVRQKLDKKFIELYKQSYSDLKISQLLKVSEQSVGNYRRNLALPSNKKQPAGTGK